MFGCRPSHQVRMVDPDQSELMIRIDLFLLSYMLHYRAKFKAKLWLPVAFPLSLAKAEAHADQCLSLPCHPQLHDDEVNKSSRQLMSSSDHRCYCVNLLFTMTTALFTRQAVSKDS